jgi:hypothetical protein
MPLDLAALLDEFRFLIEDARVPLPRRDEFERTLALLV